MVTPPRNSDQVRKTDGDSLARVDPMARWWAALDPQSRQLVAGYKFTLETLPPGSKG
jgi:hypothetical protein